MQNNTCVLFIKMFIDVLECNILEDFLTVEYGL